MSVNIPPYYQSGGYIISVPACFRGLSSPPPPAWTHLSQSAINKWDMTFHSRHLPSLASNHLFLFVKSCDSSQSSIIHLTCVSPCLGSQLWSPAAAGVCSGHHSPLVPVHSLLPGYCTALSCKWEPSPTLLGKISVQPFVRLFSQPSWVCLFSDLVGVKEKKEIVAQRYSWAFNTRSLLAEELLGQKDAWALPSIGGSCVNRCEREIFQNEAMRVNIGKCSRCCELCVKEAGLGDILLGNLALFIV